MSENQDEFAISLANSGMRDVTNAPASDSVRPEENKTNQARQSASNSDQKKKAKHERTPNYFLEGILRVFIWILAVTCIYVPMESFIPISVYIVSLITVSFILYIRNDRRWVPTIRKAITSIRYPSQWPTKIAYRGRQIATYWNSDRRVAVVALALIVFCNVTPICIESIWGPALERYMQSDKYGNHLLESSTGEENPLTGGSSYIFLQEYESNPVVSEDNNWFPFVYDGQSYYGLSFTGNESSYLCAEVEGIDLLNISLIYDNYNRFNYTLFLGQNTIPMYLGEETSQYEIAIYSGVKQYLKMLVIEPLWIHDWENVTLEYSEDTTNPKDNKITSSDVDSHIHELQFFAHGDVGIYFYSPGLSYNSLYVELNGYILQSLHPIEDESGNDEYISLDTVNSYTSSGDALKYEINLDEMFLSPSSPDDILWNGWHTLKFAVCGEYTNTEMHSDEVEIEFCIISHPNLDFDGRDGLTNDQEINTFYTLCLNPESPDTWSYWDILPEATSHDIFESDWSTGTLSIFYNDILPGLLYIDICSNISSYENFTINGLPIYEGALEDIEIKFGYDGWWSFVTDTIMQFGQKYDLSFQYNTHSEMPKDNLIFSVNGEVIPILTTGNEKRLSDDLLDSDLDGLKDKDDQSPQTSYTMSTDAIWRLLTDVEESTDTEIRISIAPAQNDLYQLTHNSSGLYYEWDDQSIVTIAPVLRVFSNVVSTTTTEVKNITYGDKNLYFSDQAWKKTAELSLDEFKTYWSDLSNADMIEFLRCMFSNVHNEEHYNGYCYPFLNWDDVSEQGTFMLDYAARLGTCEIKASGDVNTPHLILDEDVDFELYDSNSDSKLDSVQFIGDFMDILDDYLYFYVTYEKDENTISEGRNIEVINALSTPDAIDSYNLNQFGDSAPLDWNHDGVVDASPLDEISNIQEWFEYYVDDFAESGFDSYYYDIETLRYYYNEFSNTRSGSVDGQVIELSASEDTYVGSIFVPAGHISKTDEMLDLKFEILWQVTDLNILDSIIAEFNQVGTGCFGSAPTGTTITAYDEEKQIMTLCTWYYVTDPELGLVLDHTDEFSVDFNVQTIIFPSEAEVDDLLSDDPYLDSYYDWRNAYWAPTSIFDAAHVDDALLGTRLGKYHNMRHKWPRGNYEEYMKDIIGKFIPPGTKIYEAGAPKLLHLYPWEDQDTAVIQSIIQIEHEGVDYVLASPETSLENEILSTVIKNKDLWDPNSFLFDSYSGGVDLTDDIYGTDEIKHVNKLDLMTSAASDFLTETSFGMGWGSKDYKFDSVTSQSGQVFIDTVFSAQGTNSRVYETCYNHRQHVIKLGDSVSSNQYTGCVEYTIGQEMTSGSISFDVSVISGDFRFQMRDFQGTLGYEIRANPSECPNWRLSLNSVYYDLGIPITGEWQTISLVYNTTATSPFVSGYIDGTVVMWQNITAIPIENSVDSFYILRWSMTAFFGYMDKVSAPAWTQIGSQGKVLYSNAIYSKSDLTKLARYNDFFGYYRGDLFSYNGQDFYLRYNPETFLFDLYYAEEDQYFSDYFPTSLDLTTYNFNQAWLNGQMHPYFNFTLDEGQIFPETYSTKVNNGVFEIRDDFTGITEVASGFIPFKNGTLEVDIQFPVVPTSGSVLLSLNVYDYSVDVLGYVEVTSKDKSLQIGIVNGYFAYRLSGSSWISTTISISSNQWYTIEIVSFNNTVGEWKFGITIDSQSISNSLVLSMDVSELFGAISFFVDGYGMNIDDLAISTMRNVYMPFSDNRYDIISGSAFAISDFMNNVNGTISPSLMVHAGEVERDFPFSTTNGLLSFSMGVTNSMDDAAVYIKNDYSYSLVLYNNEGYWFVTGSSMVSSVNLSISVIPNIMYDWSIIFGDSDLFNQDENELTIFCNGLYIGQYPSTGGGEIYYSRVSFYAGEVQNLFINSLSLGDIPDMPTNDAINKFAFDGYWHSDIPDTFTLNGMEFAKSLYWTGEFCFPNGTVFAYINKEHEACVAENYTGPIQWYNKDWGMGFLIPTAQYKNENNEWVDGKKQTQLLWCNLSSVNSVVYHETAVVSMFGCKIVGLTADNITLNEYTPLKDWALDSPDGFDHMEPYNQMSDITFSLADFTITNPITGDVISDITPTSFKVNQGSPIPGNICLSMRADLPYGAVITYRIEGDRLAETFYQTINELISNSYPEASFDWRYEDSQTICYFESMELETDANQMASFIQSEYKQSFAVLYSIVTQEDFDSITNAIKPELQTQFNPIPMFMDLLETTVYNSTSKSTQNLYILSRELAVVECEYGHIAPLETRRIDLDKLSSTSQTRSPFVSYITEELLIYQPTYHKDIWKWAPMSTIISNIENSWQSRIIGDILWCSGSSKPIDILKDRQIRLNDITALRGASATILASNLLDEFDGILELTAILDVFSYAATNSLFTLDGLPEDARIQYFLSDSDIHMPSVEYVYHEINVNGRTLATVGVLEACESNGRYFNTIDGDKLYLPNTFLYYSNLLDKEGWEGMEFLHLRKYKDMMDNLFSMDHPIHAEIQGAAQTGWDYFKIDFLHPANLIGVGDINYHHIIRPKGKQFLETFTRLYPTMNPGDLRNLMNTVLITTDNVIKLPSEVHLEVLNSLISTQHDLIDTPSYLDMIDNSIYRFGNDLLQNYNFRSFGGKRDMEVLNTRKLALILIYGLEPNGVGGYNLKPYKLPSDSAIKAMTFDPSDLPCDFIQRFNRLRQGNPQFMAFITSQQFNLQDFDAELKAGRKWLIKEGDSYVIRTYQASDFIDSKGNVYFPQIIRDFSGREAVQFIESKGTIIQSESGSYHLEILNLKVKDMRFYRIMNTLNEYREAIIKFGRKLDNLYGVSIIPIGARNPKLHMRVISPFFDRITPEAIASHDNWMRLINKVVPALEDIMYNFYQFRYPGKSKTNFYEFMETQYGAKVTRFKEFLEFNNPDLYIQSVINEFKEPRALAGGGACPEQVMEDVIVIDDLTCKVQADPRVDDLKAFFIGARQRRATRYLELMSAGTPSHIRSYADSGLLESDEKWVKKLFGSLSKDPLFGEIFGEFELFYHGRGDIMEKFFSKLDGTPETRKIAKDALIEALIDFDAEGSVLAKGMIKSLDNVARSIKVLSRKWLHEFIVNSIFECFMFVVSIALIDAARRTGEISQDEWVQQQLMNLLFFGLDVGLEMVSALTVFIGTGHKFLAALGAVGWIAEMILMAVQYCFIIWMQDNLPGQCAFKNYKINSLLHSGERWGSLEVGDTLEVSTRYYNYDNLQSTYHWPVLYARTSSMPMNTTSCFSEEECWYESEHVCVWSLNYWCFWADMEVSIPLEYTSSNEVLTVHHRFGKNDDYGSPEYWTYYDYSVGPVVEPHLADFLDNLEVSTELTEDVDNDTIAANQEFLIGTNIRKCDTDYDNISDYWESVEYHTDPTNDDSDDDALNDYEEIFIYETDPRNPDSDDDGLFDGIEALYYSNPNLADTDSDGLSDALEFVYGTYANNSDCDNDGLSDLTEYRLGYDAMNANSPVNKLAQTALQTTPTGFYKGTHSFNMLELGSDPWYSSACTGEAYIMSNYAIGSNVHNFVYFMNQSCIRTVSDDIYMQDSWAVEFYVGMEDDAETYANKQSLSVEFEISDGHYFTMRYHNATKRFQYKYNWKDWTSFTPELSVANLETWAVWSIEWDDEVKELSFGVDLNSDETFDYSIVLDDEDWSYLDTNFASQYINLIVFESLGYANCSIDSVSVWKEFNVWFGGYLQGDLYDLIEFPDVWCTLDTISSSVTVEWAPLDEMQFGVFYSNVSDNIDIYSKNTLYQGPATSCMIIDLPRDGTYWFKPCAIFTTTGSSYFFPMGDVFNRTLDTYSATYGLLSDTLGQAPVDFTASGAVSVEETMDVLNWYSNDPFSAEYRYILLNDTSAASACSIEDTSVRLIDDGDFIEFWLKTNDSAKESKFSLIDNADQERYAIRVANNYFWLDSGSHEYNTSIQAYNNTWYHIQCTLSRSNWSELFINSEFIDNYKVDMGYDLKIFKFSTASTLAEYELWIKGIGISWLGYERYENWPELKDVDMQEKTSGFGTDSDSPSFVYTESHIISTNSETSDFLFLSENIVLVSDGRILDISGETTLLSTIWKWNTAKIHNGVLFIDAEDGNNQGVTSYNIEDPANPELIMSFTNSKYLPWFPHEVPFDLWDYNWYDEDNIFHESLVLFAICKDRWSETRRLMAWDISNDFGLNSNNLWASGEYKMFFIPDHLGGGLWNKYDDLLVINNTYLSSKWYIDHQYSAINIYAVGSLENYGGQRYEFISIPVCFMVQGFVHGFNNITGMRSFCTEFGAQGADYEDNGFYSVDLTGIYNNSLHNVIGKIELWDDEQLILVNMRCDTMPEFNKMCVLEAGNDYVSFEIDHAQTFGDSFAIDEANEQLVTVTDNVIKGFDYSNVISPEPEYSNILKIEGMQSATVKYIENSLWILENIQVGINLLTFLRKYKNGYAMDLNDWSNTSGVGILDEYDCRYNVVQVCGDDAGGSIQRNITGSPSGKMSLNLHISENSGLNISLFSVNSTHSEDSLIQINEGIMSIEGKSNPINIDAWLTMELSYVSGDSVLSIALSDEWWSIPLIANAIPVSINISCNQSAVYLDAFAHVAFDTDVDGDGLGNYEEEVVWLTSAFRVDSDGDGMPDGWEAKYGLNPTSSADKTLDLDIDGLLNIDEFKYGTKPNEDDTDRDGEEDGLEVNHGHNPLLPNDGDSDEDGLTDAIEYSFGSNPEAIDSDGDGLSDYNELINFAINPTLRDTDGDVMFDGFEVNYGLNPGDDYDKALDKDGDKILNYQEFLGNDLDDDREYETAQTNPNSYLDSDSDGMPNDWETYYNIVSPTDDSLDQDKVNNLEEFTAGTNPRVANFANGMSEDWCEYYDIEFSATGANENPDIYDKLKNSQEYAGIYSGTATDKNPNSYGTNAYSMNDQWNSYWNLGTFSQTTADLDTDGDKLKNWQEYRGNYAEFSTTVFLSPREASYSSYTYYEEDYWNGQNSADKVTFNWYTDWRVYYGLTDSLDADSDGDHVLNWQEFRGSYSGSTTWGLNPRSSASNPNEIDPDNRGMSMDWCSYWGIEYSIAGGDADADSDGAKNKDEYLRYSNPRDSDTDGDSLPDKFEIKYYHANMKPNNKDSDGDQTNDNLDDVDDDLVSNYNEYNVDSTQMRMNPLDSTTDDGDNYPDKMEYDFYMASGTALDWAGVEITPWSDNDVIKYKISVPTAAWWSHYATPSDQATIISRSTYDDGQYWSNDHNWGADLQIRLTFSDYACPVSCRSYLASVSMEYHVWGYKNNGSWANLKIRARESTGSVWQSYQMIAASPVHNYEYNGEKTVSTTNLKDETYVDQLEVFLRIDPNWWQRTYLCTDQLVVWYIF